MGVLIPQLYYYHINHAKDATWIKLLVWGLAVLEILQTCLVSADTFHWFVFNYGNMLRLDDTYLNSWDVPLLDAVVALIAQLFYCWRIWVLRKKPYVILSVIIAVSLTQCVAGIVVAVQAHALGKLSLIGENIVAQAIWLSGSALADILITATLSWTLLMASPERGVSERSRRIINKIVVVTVETNSLTAGVAIIALIIFVAIPAHAALVVPPTALMGKLYTNCLVAVLNHRSQREDNNSGSRSDSVPMSSRTRWGSRDAGRNMKSPRQDLGKDSFGVSATESFPISVTVVRDVEVDDDLKAQSPGSYGAHPYRSSPSPRAI
ncbi:hypothetical protein EXIGLDRAFT_351658 [Exidia glandulosa HHB12029]|uniref:DUF6534 domain-containing protein n=1 Tax=Exidia glandulosa HHB12029 TaxID=1314781 RepID=A0A165CCN8_EXIGL|nr:hypothetical protein EXIGLDRAFT_351658 [Exidia glandulosa HHB12029]